MEVDQDDALGMDPLPSAVATIPSPVHGPNALVWNNRDSLFQPELLITASVDGYLVPDALVDSGCQKTAISSKLASCLHLPLDPCNISIGFTLTFIY